MRTLRDIRPGQTIGRYEFLVPIAEGGMAAVWAARLKGSRGFQKILAIKTILATLSDNEQFEEMFLSEAQIAARIRHPNVAEIFDLGEEDDVLYLVMEWVDGEPLSTVFRTSQKKTGMPIGIAVRIVADAAAGLHAAHELKDDDGSLVNLVHRDVSPQNILVTYDGNVKIVDFGVAKAGSLESAKTSAGTIKGKAPYMSPEQALGQEIDRRTDIFALGIILYHLTTGKHPFRGESDLLTLGNIIERPVPLPSSFMPGFPKPLEAAIMRALDKDPARRFQTGAEFEAALDRVMPPTAPRIRSSDVGRFVRDTVGERGEQRREAIKNSVRLADERIQNELETSRLASKPVSEIGLTGQLGALSSGTMPAGFQTGRASMPNLGTGSQAALRFDGGENPMTSSQHSITSMSSPGVANTTPPGPPSATGATGRSRTGLYIGGGVALLAVLGGAGVMATKRSTPPPAVAAVATPRTDPPPAQSATPSTPAPKPEAAPVASASAAPDAIDLSALPSDKPHAAAAAAPARDTAPADKGKKDPAAPATARPKAAGGFVPPPVTDPGF